MANIFTKNHDYKYKCLCCDYNSNKKTDYNIHLHTLKHKKLTMPNNNTKKNDTSINNHYECKCGKIYKHLSSLCKHKKTCKFKDNSDISKIEMNENYKDIVFKLITEIKNLKMLCLKKIKN